jgi:hypothetical protein
MDSLKRFVTIVEEDQGTHALAETCVKCGQSMWAYDRYGVAWCQEHWNDEVELKETKYWKKLRGEATLPLFNQEYPTGEELNDE